MAEVEGERDFREQRKVTSIQRLHTFFYRLLKKEQDGEKAPEGAAHAEKERFKNNRGQGLHTRIHLFQIRFLGFLKDISGYRVVRLFRNYSAFSIVASSAFMVSASNFTEGQDAQSMLFGYVNNELPTGDALSAGNGKRLSAQTQSKENLSLVPLADATAIIDPNEKDETSLFDVESLAVENSIMLSTTQMGSIAKDPEEDGGVKIYTVQSGDTVSTIATTHNITTNTILWANDIEDVDSIRPGDQLFILPVAGLTHIVKEGETLDKIAGDYKAEKDKIIAFNELPANGEIETGDTIVIPNGQKEVPLPAPDTGIDRRQYATSSGGVATDISGWRDLTGKAGTGHRFPYGYCTWYVASKRYVPWGGNAGTWLYNAKALGYKTGKTPRPGSIVVTTENRYYGHVALVEKVSGNTITVSEMNYTGWGKTSRRTLAANSKVIKGFIY